MRAICPHLAIGASAGSGKTYKLAHRYLALMQAGEAADSICALTFSRKAAGEIFDNIAGYLIKASTDPVQAACTAGAMGVEGMSCSDFQALLRQFLNQIHRLNIATLDSFMLSVVRAFPAELGLPGDISVFSENDPQGQTLLNSALLHLFKPGSLSEQERHNFLKSFDLSTFGHDLASSVKSLRKYVEKQRGPYRLLPEAEAWGQPGRIWHSAAIPWPSASEATRQQAVDTITDWAGTLPGKPGGMLRNMAVEMAAFDPTCQLSDFGAKILNRRMWECCSAFGQRTVEIKYYKDTITISGEISRAWRVLFDHLMHILIGKAVSYTTGRHRVLSCLDSILNQLGPARGLLSFADVPSILSGTHRMSRESGSDDRLFLDYRLDGQLNHWLLDEFQDTSDLQWAVFENLIDELIQDPSGRRSFFYVGDVKQAIYGWRGGNPRLFQQVLDRYGKHIQKESMATSYRSGPAIIDTVNAVFGHLDECVLHEEANQDWARIWEEHHTQPGYDKSTFAALVTPTRNEKGQLNKEDHYAATLNILQHTQPWTRNLTTAILVRRNKAGTALYDYVRQHAPDIPILDEGKQDISVEPAVALMLSLIQYAAHPGDGFARGHIAMSPLCRDQAPPPPTSLLRSLSHGFEPFLRTWVSRLEDCNGVSPGSRPGLIHLIRQAAAYDAGSEHDIDAFLTYVRNTPYRSHGHSGCVRIMTIHQSKGLGFDVVILPELCSRSSLASRTPGTDELFLHRDAQGQPEWILDLPTNECINSDPVLMQAMSNYQRAGVFEDFCNLYVAMTRAKRVLYMVSGHTAAKSSVLDYSTLLEHLLHGPENAPPLYGLDVQTLYQTGSPDWFTDEEKQERPIVPRPIWPADFAARPSTRTRLKRVEPSGLVDTQESASNLFSDSIHDARNLGHAVHALFEVVDWADSCDVASVVRQVFNADQLEQAGAQAAVQEFTIAMGRPEIRSALQEPENPYLLWREKPFEWVSPEGWMSGVFDRVVLDLDSSGRPVSAVIQDYKSNRIQDEDQLHKMAEHYRGQLEAYRGALQHLTGLSGENIQLQLLFTQPGRVVEL